MRQLKENLLKKLKDENKLKTLLNHILSDKDLDIQIRDNYINVYYKGGNILKISPKSFYIDEMYFNDYNKQNSTEAKKNTELVNKYKKQQKELLSLIPSNPKKYFEQAKEVMDKWDEALKDVVKHKEKKEQQMITLANKCNTEYVVLDIEYSVSRKSDFSYNFDSEKAVPRFDIIAIHNSRLLVIELKKGLGAINGKSGIKQHIKCFDNTIGKDDKLSFVKEMQELLEQKKKLGLLDKSLKIIDNEKPTFVFAFADKEGENEFKQFKEKCHQKGYEGKFIYVNSEHQLEGK